MRTTILVSGIVGVIAASAPAAAKPGVAGLYAGSTPQGWPAFVEVAHDGRTITRAAIALERTCTSGGYVTSDTSGKVAITRTGAFSSSYGPESQDNGDGTHTDYTGSLKGRLDRRHGRISLTWRLQSVKKDAAGNAIDTCDSGAVAFTVKQ
jgi:hypothetical protein